MANKTYRALSSAITALENCKKSGNTTWQEKHEEVLERLMQNAPSGSGFNSGTELIAGSMDKLVFKTAFHHMDEMGGYDGWTEHKVTVTGSLLFDYNIKISGRDRNNIKEYMTDVFCAWLDEEVKV